MERLLRPKPPHDMAFLELLLAAGAHINATDSQGGTALHAAARAAQFSVLECDLSALLHLREEGGERREERGVHLTCQ